MSTYLDIETDRYWDDEAARHNVEWLTIKCEFSRVVIGREHIRWDGIRCVDADAGIAFRTKHLDAIIDALMRVRAETMPGDRMADAKDEYRRGVEAAAEVVSTWCNDPVVLARVNDLLDGGEK